MNKAYNKLTKKKSKKEKAANDESPLIVETKEMQDPSATGGSQTKNWLESPIMPTTAKVEVEEESKEAG